MRITIEKDTKQYLVKEDDRIIYTVSYIKENGLRTVVLKNLYDEEVFSAYQMKRWYTKLLRNKVDDFTIYAKDEKIGEIHKNENGYEATYYDVFYHFINIKHVKNQYIICMDKKHQEAEMLFENDRSILRFRNTTLQAFFILMNVVMKECIDIARFPKQNMLQTYDGSYEDTYDELKK